MVVVVCVSVCVCVCHPSTVRHKTIWARRNSLATHTNTTIHFGYTKNRKYHFCCLWMWIRAHAHMRTNEPTSARTNNDPSVCVHQQRSVHAWVYFNNIMNTWDSWLCGWLKENVWMFECLTARARCVFGVCSHTKCWQCQMEINHEHYSMTFCTYSILIEYSRRAFMVWFGLLQFVLHFADFFFLSFCACVLTKQKRGPILCI